MTQEVTKSELKAVAQSVKELAELMGKVDTAVAVILNTLEKREELDKEKHEHLETKVNVNSSRTDKLETNQRAVVILIIGSFLTALWALITSGRTP